MAVTTADGCRPHAKTTKKHLQKAMEIKPIAHFRSPFATKFGIPRQSGIVPQLRGRIIMEPQYASAEALRGLDGFDYLWLVWGFSANAGAPVHLTVRPPRLGGNARMGVFATRSPFRPNGLGLSSVRLEGVSVDTAEGAVITVSGADLMDGTPIYDIKPYVAFTDSHAAARSGFADTERWGTLKVEYDKETLGCMDGAEAEALLRVLEQDPRPQYHDDPQRIYGMPYGQWDVRFRVADGILTIVEIVGSR